MKLEQRRIVIAMGRWTINLRSVILLLGVLIVIVLVLVLPQVDLLDTAFQCGTAPIAIHAQGTERPAFQILSVLLIFFLFKTGLADQRSENRLLTISTHAVRILNHCFRC